MRLFREMPATMETASTGTLKVEARSLVGFRPLPGGTVTIRPTGSEQILEVLQTDESGNTPEVTLPTPPLELSMVPEYAVNPYAQYDLIFQSPEAESVFIQGTQVFAGQESLQEIRAVDRDNPDIPEVPVTDQPDIIIGPNTLNGDFPPKIPEDPVKPLPTDESGFVVLNDIVIPEFIVVHDGPPNSDAPNYWVRYDAYIKNVASCEIYSTWPTSTITANVLAIMSFTLNRVFTEWYRNQGYNFTITSSTAYDHKFIYGRNIFNSIAQVVDSVLTNYITKPGIEQPLLTQYCDGQRVSCPGWMTQWGSKYLGDQGYDAVSILRNFYGPDIYLNTAPQVAGIPASFPGYNLSEGSRGDAVRTIQRQLNAIANNYPAIPKVPVDGIFGPQTAESVRVFQEVFNLPPNGIVDYPTWYRISQIYVAVTEIAELR